MTGRVRGPQILRRYRVIRGDFKGRLALVIDVMGPLTTSPSVRVMICDGWGVHNGPEVVLKMSDLEV